MIRSTRRFLYFGWFSGDQNEAINCEAFKVVIKVCVNKLKLKRKYRRISKDCLLKQPSTYLQIFSVFVCLQMIIRPNDLLKHTETRYIQADIANNIEVKFVDTFDPLKHFEMEAADLNS